MKQLYVMALDDADILDMLAPCIRDYRAVCDELERERIKTRVLSAEVDNLRWSLARLTAENAELISINKEV